MSPAPLVSIILATYNRSRVLAHAVESVRRSTLTDWELIVVGDCCTDDSEAVVASFQDPRITFVNLARNAGEQSGPNNEGLRRATGQYVAYLNHDDMYFPDHLASAVDACRRLSADFVWSPLLVGLPMSDAELSDGRWRFRLSGVTPDDGYDPRVFVFASAWLMTSDLARRVGEWRPARDTFVTSSQDWVHRAWQSGARMRMLPRVSVIALPASTRQGSYTAGGSPEHDYFAARLADPGFRERALEVAAIGGERESNRFRLGLAIPETLRALAFRPISVAAKALGWHPYAPFFALRHGRRGNVVSAIRRKSGLNSLTRKPQG